MLKGFQISPDPVDHVPLNIIRCQQLVDQKAVPLEKLSSSGSKNAAPERR